MNSQSIYFTHFALQDSLKVVEDKVASLLRQYEDSMKKKSDLESSKVKTVEQLERAEQLVRYGFGHLDETPFFHSRRTRV